MKVRVKFSKQGDMKFIGHLDIMRFFQKAIRRSGLDIHYSEGMSPHMVMSFAAPLGVGLTSDGEYMDIELNTPVSTQEGIRRLNACMVEGMRVLDFRQIEEGKAGKGMALVAAADYLVKLRDPLALPEGWTTDFVTFFAQSKEICILKETKKGETLLDIKPLIYQVRPQEDGLFLQVSTGSVANLKPETVIQAYADAKGHSLPEFSLLINRLEVYADTAAESEHHFVPLSELGWVIEVEA